MVTCLRINSLNKYSVPTMHQAQLGGKTDQIIVPALGDSKSVEVNQQHLKSSGKCLKGGTNQAGPQKNKWKCIRWRVYKGGHAKGRSNSTAKTRRRGELCHVRTHVGWVGKTLELIKSKHEGPYKADFYVLGNGESSGLCIF